MVLSNKKLKQKLRAKLLSSLTQTQTQTQTNSNVVTPQPVSSSNNSLKLLLDSASHKPILSKREKRRKLRPLQQDGGEGTTTNNNKENTTEEQEDDGSDKKKNKKRKRNKVVEVQVEEKQIQNNNNNDAVASDGVVKVINLSKKKKLKLKKKRQKQQQKKNKRNAKLAEENGSNHDAAMPEQTKNKKPKTAVVNGSNHQLEIPKSTVTAVAKTNTITSQENGDVPTKVYVGGIPYYSTEDDIRSYFEGCGTITEIDCMYFPESGKFRGIAFINFKTEAAAKRALALDGSDMGGLFLKIQPYKATQAARFAPKMLDGYNRIYAGNLSWEITEEDLKKFFSECNIKSIKFGMDKETEVFRGYAHVDFSDSQSLKTALTLDQSVLFGRPVRISCAVPLKKKPSADEKTGAGAGAGEKPDNTGGEKADNTGGERPDAAAGEKPGEEPSPPVNNKMKKRMCYGCRQKGHSLSECPNKQTDASTTI